jgi:hypothetical protein
MGDGAAGCHLFTYIQEKKYDETISEFLQML